MAAAVPHRAGGAAGVRRVRERRAPTEPMIDRLHWLAGAAAFGLLTGCGTYGDFGRVRPSLVNDDTHAWMGPAAARGPRNQSGLDINSPRRSARCATSPIR